jgi:hypothetical protein
MSVDTSAGTIVGAAPDWEDVHHRAHPSGTGTGRAKLSYRSPRSQTRKMLEQRSG